MDEETAARVVRDALVEVARDGRTITYDELLERAGGDARELLRSQMAAILRRISTEEDAAGRGLLTAVVVRSDTGRPGKGWFDLAAQRGRRDAVTDPERTWEEEVKLVHQAAREA